MLSSTESALVGTWELRHGEYVADAVCQRIGQLISSHLRRVCADPSGWHTLYQDPLDMRYWVLSYPQSEMHGGGPPALVTVSSDEAAKQFPLAAASNTSLQVRRP